MSIITTAQRRANATYLQLLNDLAQGTPYDVECHPIVRHRGWPEASARPWHLYEGTRLVACFTTPAALRARLTTLKGA